MKLSTAFLVAVLAIIATSATEQQGPKVVPTAGPPQVKKPPMAEPRQGRGIDFLGPFRSIFGGSRPRGSSGGKQYGVKPSETQNKPNTASPYDTQGPFKPSNFPNFNDGGFGSDFGPPTPPSQGRPLRQLHKYPHGPQGGPPGGPHGGSHGGPNGGPHGGPPQGVRQGHNGHFGFQQAPQHTYNTYAEPQIKHHHYHQFMQNNNNGQYNEGPQGQDTQQYNDIPKPAAQYNEASQGPAPYDSPKATPLPYDGPKIGPYDSPAQYDAQSQNYYPQQQNYDNPQTAQQSNRPVSQPGPSPAGGFEPQNNNNGFTEFGGFGPSSFGQQGPASQGQGEFFGGAQNYPEQYEEQTRNTREPEIITADYQNQGPESYPQYNQGSFQGGPQGAPSYNYPADSYSGPPGPPSNNGPPQGGSGPIIKSHPLRASAAGHGRPRYGGPPGYGNQGESRPQPYLYRPVASSIRVPGAVDEDAVYGKPMMMSASNKKPISAKFRGAGGPQPSKAHPVYNAPPTQAPFLKPEGIVTLESPQDPKMRHAASFQNGMIVEPDTAASGHHGHHGGHHGHELESANGDRILYHVSGHQGPYSYRFGYDTGKGYNRMFRFEEKDGKGYVTGKYGFYDKHGKLNVVNYQAHPEHGYHAERDHGHHHQTHTIKH